MRRASIPVEPEVDAPKDASSSAVALRWILGFFLLTALIVLGAMGISAYTDVRTVVRGTVLARRVVRGRALIVTGRYGANHPTTVSERRVLRIRTETGETREYDVAPHFWNEAHDGDRIRREGGIWRVDRATP